MNLPELPEPEMHPAYEYTGVTEVVGYKDCKEYARAYGEECARMERERLLPLLAHAVREADGWHDECRGGPILRDPIMDAARVAVTKNA